MSLEVKRYVAFEDTHISLDAVGVIYEITRVTNRRSALALALELEYMFIKEVFPNVEGDENELRRKFKEIFDFSTHFEKNAPWEKVRSECFEDPTKYLLVIGDERNPKRKWVLICDRKKKPAAKRAGV